MEVEKEGPEKDFKFQGGVFGFVSLNARSTLTCFTGLTFLGLGQEAGRASGWL